MTKQTIFIDNLTFAKRNERLLGELSLADCPRLNELLQAPPKIAPGKFTPSASIKFNLQGKLDGMGQASLSLALEVNLNCLCQRCLNAMPLNLALNFDYLLGELDEGHALSTDMDEADDFDWQAYSPHMDVIGLIEDELIMAMPIAPVHQQHCGSANHQSSEKPNPFAVLKHLIQS